MELELRAHILADERQAEALLDAQKEADNAAALEGGVEVERGVFESRVHAEDDVFAEMESLFGPEIGLDESDWDEDADFQEIDLDAAMSELGLE